MNEPLDYKAAYHLLRDVAEKWRELYIEAKRDELRNYEQVMRSTTPRKEAKAMCETLTIWLRKLEDIDNDEDIPPIDKPIKPKDTNGMMKIKLDDLM